jgi:predicted small secreted protein
MRVGYSAVLSATYRLAWIVLILRVHKLNVQGGRIMRSAIFALLMLALAAANLACNTVHGFGRDVERAGEKTQDAADWVKKKL